jgi:hypothetical protein
MDRVTPKKYIMKTAALILGLVSVCAFTSCRCDIDEKEEEKTAKIENKKRQISGNSSESDTLNIQ